MRLASKSAAAAIVGVVLLSAAGGWALGAHGRANVSPARFSALENELTDLRREIVVAKTASDAARCDGMMRAFEGAIESYPVGAVLENPDFADSPPAPVLRDVASCYRYRWPSYDACARAMRRDGNDPRWWLGHTFQRGWPDPCNSIVGTDDPKH